MFGPFKSISCIVINLIVCLSVQAQVDKTWSDHYWVGPDNIKFHYVEQGQGVPVILIHGLGSSAVGNWFNTGIAQKLAVTNRVIAIDMRAHGETPKQPENNRGTMVEDIVALMDALNIEKAHIGGYSMGGATTIGLLKYAPERFISALVLGAGIPASEGWVKATSRGTDLENDNRMNSSLNLNGITFPVLVVNGSEDRAEQRQQQFESGLSNLTYVTIPAANHMTAVRDPIFTEALVNFITVNNTVSD